MLTPLTGPKAGDGQINLPRGKLICAQLAPAQVQLVSHRWQTSASWTP